jgi:hypothetical protein
MAWPKTEGIPVTTSFLKKNILAVGIGSEPEKPGRFWYWQVDENTGKVDPLLTPLVKGTSVLYFTRRRVTHPRRSGS